MAIDDQESRATRPTIETVLDRMLASEARLTEMMVSLIGRVDGRLNAIEGRLNAIEGRLDAIEGRLATAENQVVSLREDMNRGFSKLRDEILVIHEDNLEIRATHRDVLRRIKELESKAS